MRVAFITNEHARFSVGGAGSYAETIISTLGKLGHEVLVFFPRDSSCDMKRLKIDGAIFVPVPVNSQSLYPSLDYSINVPSCIRAENRVKHIDAIHINGLSYLFIKKRILDCPHILTVHHLARDAATRNSAGIKELLLDIHGENNIMVQILEGRAIMSADWILAVSDYTRNQIASGMNVDRDRIRVVHPGVRDLTHLINEPSGRMTLPLVPWPKGRIILTVGRLDDPRKDIGTLIDAFALLSKKKEAVLILAGPGDKDYIRGMAERADVTGKVVLTGPVSDEQLATLYSLCDVYVTSSLLEGFGLTLVEAMSFGKPVVTTKVGAIPEIVEDGQNGFVVSPKDREGMARAILELLDNDELARQIGERNREHWREFSGDGVAKQVEEFYNFLSGVIS